MWSALSDPEGPSRKSSNPEHTATLPQSQLRSRENNKTEEITETEVPAMIFATARVSSSSCVPPPLFPNSLFVYFLNPPCYVTDLVAESARPGRGCAILHPAGRCPLPEPKFARPLACALRCLRFSTAPLQNGDRLRPLHIFVVNRARDRN